ncbi:hypothetical protein GTY65_32405 [Streptomyces sp. SID8379]|uniref:hypothetical protein n=1 Tax=unclassified Streptomyces TaxID=2593676 RepID=UPI00035EC2D3|nr:MULTISPECIES: hypothetical protein [unclassified Streptomyces]MYW68746.1 hypothetical protein [Streptomyces sp. SID8379]
MRRSTLLTRALGTGALAAAATSQALVHLPADASGPRLDIVGALAAAAVLTAAWALACRTAPPLKPEPALPPRAGIPPIPARLPRPDPDVGRAVGAVLIALAPVTLARLAMRDGTSFVDMFLFFLILFGTLKLATGMRRSTSPKDERAKVKVLIEDAAAGEVHGVRVRAGRPQLLRYSERGDRPGTVSVSRAYHLALFELTEDAEGEVGAGDEVPLAVDRIDIAELARAGTLLTGSEGWLVWPRRYKLIEGAQPVAFVADRDGATIMGLTDPAEVTYRTATASARDPRRTSRERSARRLRRNAKFRTPIHGPIAGGALLAALLCLPVLLVDRDALSGLISWPLCVPAGAALITGVLRGTSATMDCVVADAEWTVREESDPEIA